MSACSFSESEEITRAQARLLDADFVVHLHLDLAITQINQFFSECIQPFFDARASSIQ
jgi:hypothetical protein